MSQNQIRVEKKEKQYRKTGGGGRPNNNSSDQLYRSVSATGRGASTAPPLSSNSASNNRSFKKSNNAQSGQSRGHLGYVNTTSGPNPASSSVHLVENGNHVQSTLHVSSTTAQAAGKPADTSSQKSSQPSSKAQSSAMTTSSTLPSTSSKGEAGKGFPLQFGSINPGFMNGLQVPARTTSAPPDLDEQKLDQVRHTAARTAPAISIPSAPKQQVPDKHVSSDQSMAQETHTVLKVTRDVQVTSAPSPNQSVQAQKPALLPMAGMSVPIPYHQHQPPVPIQFGGPNPHIQTPGAPNNSLQMPMRMPLHIGNPPQVQQQVFVPGLQHHIMKNQGTIHQGQSFGFNPQLGPQLPHQPGNIGMAMSPQFNLQQPGNVGSTRKIIKITHPETREELRLDNREGGSAGSRTHQMGSPQSQPVPSFAAMRPSGYYSTYSPGPPVFPVPNSLPVTSTQLQSTSSSQAPRFNYPISQGPPAMPFINQSASNFSVNGKNAASMCRVPESSNLDLAQSFHNVVPSVTSPLVNFKVAADSGMDKGSDFSEKVASQKLIRSIVDQGAIRKDEETKPDETSLESKSNSVSLKKSNLSPLSNKDVIRQQLPGKKEHFQSSSQVGVQTGSSELQDHDNSFKVAAPGYAEAAISDVPLVPRKDSCAISDAASPATPVENNASKDHHSTHIGCLLQPTEIQGKKEVGGLLSDSASKNLDFVKNAAGFEASQGESDFVAYETEGDNPALEAFTPENVSKPMLKNEAAPASVVVCETNLGQEVESLEKARPTSSSGSVSGLNKASAETNKTKNNKWKKKRKEMLQKADALGTTTDLYMAYKGPEEKKESVGAGEGVSRSNLKVSSYYRMENSLRKEKDESSKLELEDWEDAADVSTPKLESSVLEQGIGSHHDEGSLAKKYSRDFLLTFSEQFFDLPEDFHILPDFTDILLRFNISSSHNDHDNSSSGRIYDKASGATRHDRRVNGMMDADRWNKSGPQFSGRDPGIDLSYGNHMMGLRSSPGPNCGVLRNPRGQGTNQHPGGVLSMHPLGFQGIQRNSIEMERWQRATSFNKGLMPVPHTPAQVMHRAENKYEVGKVSDEEQVKQRRLKAILNKLTPQNFDKLFEQVKEVNIDNAVTLSGVISQIFDKALMEPTFCEMYANFCHHLALELPDLSVDDEKITFKRLLLNKCQEEFERGEREEEEANKADDEGDNKQTEEDRERKRLNARRRMLGNIRLIGELYKKRMLTERIMHECIKKLLGQYQNVDEENIEALCKLMSTIGEMIDHLKAKEHMDAYFDIMGQLSNNMKLSSRVRFMLKDAIDLRKNKWQQRRKVEGPKKIEEVHRDAAQERLGQAGRLGRGPSSSAMRRGPPVEYTPRGSTLPSPVGQMGGFRNLSTQFRGYGGQDVRTDDRTLIENRTLSVPLPHRSSSDDPITLGPQGGLARGMSYRGPSVSIAASTDTAHHGDSKKFVSGLNGFTNGSEHGAYSSREEHFSGQAAERFGAPVAYDHSRSLHLNSMYTNQDVKNPRRSMDKPMPTSSFVARAVAAPVENIASEKVWPEERLRDMSMSAIKEFYSANDEKEVALCIKDLNNTKFYPTVISIWVADAFERKDLERDMLAKLIVNLSKSQDDGIFSQQQLVEGFESVLKSLEDTVTDAPKAPEFLGQIFGKVIVENILPFKEVGRLIHKGGEEPGRLLEIGLAADVLGSVLEMMQLEKGESTLEEIRTSSGVRFEDFRPPLPLKSKKLDKFIV